MKNSKESFEEYYAGAFDFTPEHSVNVYADERTRAAYRVWDAATMNLDAHWREKLQSEEMADIITDVFLQKITTNEAIAAISKEMGV